MNEEAEEDKGWPPWIEAGNQFIEPFELNIQQCRKAAARTNVARTNVNFPSNNLT